MTHPASEEAVAALIGQRYRPPVSVIPCRYGHNSRVFDVALDDRHLIVRTHENPDVFAHTANNLEALARLGLPVPILIACDLTRSHVPFAYMILEKIPGIDLGYAVAGMTHAQMSAVATQVAGFQRTVATLPQGDGYGWTPVGQAGPFESWRALIYDMLARSIAAAGPHIGADVLTTTTRLVERLMPYLETVQPTCFLDDLTVKNVIVENGVLRGIVDFDNVCYGDPLLTIALAQTGMTFDVGEPGQYYIEELCRHSGVDEEKRRVVDCYSLIMALEFLSYDFDDEAALRRGKATITRWSKALVR